MYEFGNTNIHIEGAREDLIEVAELFISMGSEALSEIGEEILSFFEKLDFSEDEDFFEDYFDFSEEEFINEYIGNFGCIA